MAQITLNSSGVASSGSLLLQTNGTTTQATVDSSGNLGLGVTPSAWSGYTAFQFGARGSLATTGSQSSFNQNAYYNGTNWIYLASSYASRYNQVSGQHEWYNAASGTAGGTVTFTQAMTLDASGNLALNTTSPTNPANKNFTVNGGSTDAAFVLSVADTRIGQLYAASGSEVRLSAVTSVPLTFRTADTERARIDSSGNLLVGVTSGAGNRLYVKGEGSTSSTYAVNVENSGGNTMFRIRNDYQSVIYGAYSFTTASAANVNVDSTGALARSTSALKYKQDIRNLESVNISAFRPVRYKSKCENDDQTKDHIGLIADEYVNSFPELVQLGAEGEVEGFAYERLTVVLLKALQELKSEFDAYKATHP